MIKDVFEIEEFCYELFRKYLTDDFQVIRPQEGDIFDLEIKNIKTNEIIIVEIKYYRIEVHESILNRAIVQLNETAQKHSGNKKLLLIFGALDSGLTPKIKSETVALIDLNFIYYLIKNDAELLRKFNSLINKLNLKIQFKKSAKSYKIPFLKWRTIRVVSEYEQLEKLKTQLTTFPAGNEYAKAFEKLALEILKYLFDEHLINWQYQKRTFDSLNIFDVICRVSYNTHPFWLELKNDFKSKYIIFEFKNYTDKITPKEVYVSERYLYKTALRNVAFIISRTGATKNAILAVTGALKEHGKLIMLLNDDDLLKMIGMKLAGDIPEEYLYEKLDTMLMEVNRS